MLTGNLVRVRIAKGRVIPLYLRRDDPFLLETAESLIGIVREGIGSTRGEIEAEIDELLGEGMANLAQRGLAKVLEDRCDYEVVARVPPEELREKVFLAAADYRKSLESSGPRAPFRREVVLEKIADEFGLTAEEVAGGLFADLKDEARLLRGDETITARKLIDRYNIALAQAVLLRSTNLAVEVRGEKPARYRQLFRKLKFHRLMHRVEGSMSEGYVFRIDGPLSLFSSTNKYGLQMAMFLPALLHCERFRLDAEVRWGPKKIPLGFHLEHKDGLVPADADAGTYVPAEIPAFLERFRQIAPDWEASEATDFIELGREGVWVPDFRFVHRPSGLDVFAEVLGFWKRSSLERLTRLLPIHGPARYLLLISERLRVDEESTGASSDRVVRFKEIPNAAEVANRLDAFLQKNG